jgi:hypothetical protein
MMRGAKLLMAVVLAALDVAPAAMGAPVTIAPLHGETSVKVFGNVAVWSDYDPTSKSWHLVVWNAGRVSMPSIESAPNEMEADVGPGPPVRRRSHTSTARGPATSSSQISTAAVLGGFPVAPERQARQYGALMWLG